MTELTPRQAIREGVKRAIEPLQGSLVTEILSQFDAAGDPAETPFIRIITLAESVLRLNTDEDQRTLQLAIQAVCAATGTALDKLEAVAIGIEQLMGDENQFKQYTEHPIDEIQLTETQFPELDDQPNAYVALVYQITYTTQREG